jgi:hypothetical protein
VFHTFKETGVMSGTADDANGSKAELVPVPEVLTTLSHEVRVLSDSVNDLQDLIGNLVVAGAFGGSQSLYELQCLDRLSQSLDAVSNYLGGISKLAKPEWKIDVSEALSSVKLADVSERLSGIKSETSDAEQSGAGDFEDFALTS